MSVFFVRGKEHNLKDVAQRKKEMPPTVRKLIAEENISPNNENGVFFVFDIKEMLTRVI
jgi:hypothetical protein